MIKIHIIGNHEIIKSYLGVWLKAFGFAITENTPHFTIEVFKSNNNVITHSNQSELSELAWSLIREFGIYEVVCDKRLTEKADLSISAYSDLSNIECVILSKLLAQAIRKFYE